jgi:hypothetical protein
MIKMYERMRGLSGESEFSALFQEEVQKKKHHRTILRRRVVRLYTSA